MATVRITTDESVPTPYSTCIHSSGACEHQEVALVNHMLLISSSQNFLFGLKRTQLRSELQEFDYYEFSVDSHL